MKVAFTGHRPDKIGGYDCPNHPDVIWVREKLGVLIRQFVEKGYTEYIVGGALGVDTWAWEICIGLKKEFSRVKVTLAAPFPSQDAVWRGETKEHYRHLKSLSDEVIYVSDDPYTPQKMQLRNEWMVNHCDILVAVWDGTPGGTCNCVRYALKVGRPIYRLDPRAKTCGWYKQ